MRRTATAVLILALAACGRRSPPLPPELVQPLPPTSLVARSIADGVEVAWHRPDKYSGGQHMRDLGGFDIERALVDGPGAGIFVRVDHLELTDQYRFRIDPRIQWIDAAALMPALVGAAS